MVLAPCFEPGYDLQSVQRSASQPSRIAKSTMISALTLLRTLFYGRSAHTAAMGPPFRCYQFAFATTCRVACLLWWIQPGSRPADRDFYFRASDGLVSFPVAGYDYGGNWASSTGGISARWNGS